MGAPWFRFYSETLGDRKIDFICRTTGKPRALIVGVWATVLALANDSPVRGALLLTKEIPLSADDLAMHTGLDVMEVQELVEVFQQLDMLTVEDSTIHVTNWGKRQFSGDCSTDRVREWRERQRQDDECGDDDDGCGNDDATLQKQPECVAVTVPDTETETESETETEEEGAGAPATPPQKPPGKPESKKTPEAVKVFRANTHRYPAKAWYADVDEAVGDAEADLDFWGNVVKAWVGLGWNPSNVKGMLDFYGRREIPAIKGNTRTAQSKHTMGKPPALPVDPAQVERDRAALRAHRAKQKAEVANVG